jgi:hypothetical protein
VLHHISTKETFSNLLYNINLYLEEDGHLFIREPYSNVATNFMIWVSNLRLPLKICDLFLRLGIYDSFFQVAKIRLKLLKTETPVVRKWFNLYGYFFNELAKMSNLELVEEGRGLSNSKYHYIKHT